MVLVDTPVRSVVWILVALLGVWIVSTATGMAGLQSLVFGLGRSLVTAPSGPMAAGGAAGSWLTHNLGWFAAGLMGLTFGAFRHRDASQDLELTTPEGR